MVMTTTLYHWLARYLSFPFRDNTASPIALVVRIMIKKTSSQWFDDQQ